MLAWAALLDGTLRYEGLSRTDSRFELRLTPCHAANAAILSDQERQAVRMLLLGRAQKEIASELRVSITTASTLIRVGLRRLGFPCWQHIVLAAAFLERAAKSDSRDSGCELRIEDGTYTMNVELSSALLNLTQAEREVVLAAVYGGSNEQIAAKSKKSTRTVANQLASAFKKLGAHGRAELLRCIVQT